MRRFLAFSLFMIPFDTLLSLRRSLLVAPPCLRVKADERCSPVLSPFRSFDDEHALGISPFLRRVLLFSISSESLLPLLKNSCSFTQSPVFFNSSSGEDSVSPIFPLIYVFLSKTSLFLFQDYFLPSTLSYLFFQRLMKDLTRGHFPPIFAEMESNYLDMKKRLSSSFSSFCPMLLRVSLSSRTLFLSLLRDESFFPLSYIFENCIWPARSPFQAKRWSSFSVLLSLSILPNSTIWSPHPFPPARPLESGALLKDVKVSGGPSLFLGGVWCSFLFFFFFS